MFRKAQDGQGSAVLAIGPHLESSSDQVDLLLLRLWIEPRTPEPLSLFLSLSVSLSLPERTWLQGVLQGKVEDTPSLFKDFSY